ncbi:MAG: amino acid ABC transporter permease, partial [bacterium]
EFIRGTPLLVQLYIAYFFIGTVLHLQPITAGIASLALFAACYFAEIFRAGIGGVAAGEILAARALGFKERQIYRYIIFPQALQRVLPAMLGQFTSIVKDSSLLSVIAITELAKAGREAVLDSFKSFEIWFTVALIYLMLNLFFFGVFYLCRFLRQKKSA